MMEEAQTIISNNSNFPTNLNKLNKKTSKKPMSTFRKEADYAVERVKNRNDISLNTKLRRSQLILTPGYLKPEQFVFLM